MKITDSIKILHSLASGQNPETGKRFAPESAFVGPKVIRALYCALEELESRERRRERKGKSRDGSRPRNAGRPWHVEGDVQLVAQWENGATVDEIAAEMERPSAGIAARLVRLGKVADRDEARGRAYQAYDDRETGVYPLLGLSGNEP